jgi:cytoskeletal protein RodZ
MRYAIAACARSKDRDIAFAAFAAGTAAVIAAIGEQSFCTSLTSACTHHCCSLQLLLPVRMYILQEENSFAVTLSPRNAAVQSHRAAAADTNTSNTNTSNSSTSSRPTTTASTAAASTATSTSSTIKPTSDSPRSATSAASGASPRALVSSGSGSSGTAASPSSRRQQQQQQQVLAGPLVQLLGDNEQLAHELLLNPVSLLIDNFTRSCVRAECIAK